MKNVRFVGLDVHAQTIAVAVAEPGGEVRGLRQGRRMPAQMTAWGSRHRVWLKQQYFEQPAQQTTLEDYLHEVEHQSARVEHLERAIDAAVQSVPPRMRAVIEALQSLRGVAQVSAVTLVAELGEIGRFAHPRQLMSYTGMVSREHSSGERIRRGAISKVAARRSSHWGEPPNPRGPTREQGCLVRVPSLDP